MWASLRVSLRRRTAWIARNEFRKAKGFGDKVVTTHFEAFDFVALAAVGRQEDGGHANVHEPQIIDQLKPGAVGQVMSSSIRLAKFLLRKRVAGLMRWNTCVTMSASSSCSAMSAASSFSSSHNYDKGFGFGHGEGTLQA